MVFFDLFRKSKKQKNSKTASIVKSSFDEQKNNKMSLTTNDLSDSSIFNIKIEGETLVTVDYKDFSNQEDNIVFVVPKEVKSIYPYAFSRIKNLKTVIMHRDIRYIDQTAFHGCEKLQSVIGLEESETMKNFNGFNGCYNLEEITIPQNVEIIGETGLRGCKKISKIKLPDSCWYIYPSAFEGCEGLKYIEIPANMELISTNAFKGCKNLTVVFLDDNEKKYLEDYLEKYFDSTDMYDLETVCEELELEKNILDNETKENLYDDLNVKYKKINLLGKEMVWTIGKVIIQKNAFSDVKEVICFNNNIVKKVISSGYKGKITIFDREKQIRYSVDFKLMETLKKEQQAKERNKYYNQFLIPSGGTANWKDICEEKNYRHNGYYEHVVGEIKISEDSRIEISDYTQPGNNGEEEFFTSITFYKKELDNDSIYAPHIYDRAYSIYYPYGARFNVELLKKIGYALSSLINSARDLNQIPENQEFLANIANKQKQLIELFVNGTNDKMVVEKIIGNTQNLFIDGRIREATTQKDWLPYYTELEKQKVLKKENKE